MRVCIYGAGSLGTILGAYITRKGESIDLINRNKAHVEALKAQGAQVTGTVSFTQKVHAMLPEEMEGHYDIIFLMTKQQHNAQVVTFLKGYLADDGVMVTLQNGLPEVKRLLELMGPVTVEENFIGTRWSKLLINSAFSGMSTVLGCTFGEAAKPMASRKIVLGLIKECIDVCAAAGIRIEPVQGKDAVKLLNYNGPVKRAVSLLILPIAIRKHARLKASMLQDIEHGKKTEVDAINGAISAFGHKIGHPTPLNDKVTEIIHRIENGEFQPGWELMSQFK